MTPDEFVISIKPCFARAIFLGSKTVEIRRRTPRLNLGTRLWVYVTQPVGRIEGTVIVKGVSVGAPDEIWDAYGSETALSRHEFDAYSSGVSTITAIKISNIMRLRSIPVETLKELRPSFHPPQVMTRLSDAEVARLSRQTKA